MMALLVAALPVIAPASSSVSAPDKEEGIDWARERQFWAFRGPVTSPAPQVRNKRWPRQPMDVFILARLEQKNLSPTLEADRRTLMRRASYDLTGLPPTPQELERFLADGRADAYDRLVNRLLDSPRFGERMASLWLPLARYAEDQAHQVGSDTKFFYPNAHWYRSWVIGAFNRDLPYDQFIRLQLAADIFNEPKGTDDTPSPDLAALGFIGLGPKYYNRNRLDVMADEWEDRVDTVTRTLLGLTVACSRCHDHKFEPVTTEDYYALAGVFASTRMVNKVPGGAAPKEDNSETPPKEKLNPAALHIVEEGTPTNLMVFIRGNVERKGPVAERRFLRVLCDGEPTLFRDGSGRRELAEAITSRGNPLTARVMVNRLWGHFFGRPIVATPSNFGHSGTPPTHPDLLDDLAVRFMDSGWSVKSLVREMVLSSTYRQSSGGTVGRGSRRAETSLSITARQEPRPTGLSGPNDEADPSNELLSRMPRRRLSVEQWRDSVLYASGELNFAGGPSLELDDPKNDRRTVHARVSRLKLNDLLTQFDYPDANVHAEKRATTTTTMLKLFMLNSPFMFKRAKALADRVAREAGPTDDARIAKVYQLLFSREPLPDERRLALDFLARLAPAETPRWVQYAQMLLSSNEALYVD